MNVLLIAVVPLILLVGGVPLFIALLAAALGGIVLSTNPIQAIHSAMYGSLDIFPLLAVPLFIYAGDIMSRGGIARRPVPGPGFERAQTCLLEGFLGRIEITEVAQQRGHGLRPGACNDIADPALVRHGATLPGMKLPTGRIS